MLGLLLALTFTAVDGDTLTAGAETIRILNIDAPETRDAKCDAERRLGHVAKRRLQELLDEGDIVITRGDGDRMTDRYGRTLARVSAKGEDVGDQLVAEELARPWTGHRRSWCAK